MSSDGAPSSGRRGARSLRRRGTCLRSLVCLCAALAGGTSVADERVDGATLEASPGTCVALHKGQPCFRRVVIRWSLPDDGRRYCLRRADRDEPLLCWRGEGAGRHEHDYGSRVAERFVLTLDGADETLAEAIVRTAWVHRSNRRGAGGWRLF